MARRVAILVVLGVLVLGSSLAGGRILAQEADGVPAEHPLVGSWLIVFPDNPAAPPSLYTFGADGTVVGSSVAGARHGTWEATGDRVGAFTVLGLAGDEQTAFLGLLQLSGSIDVAADGNEFTLVYHAAAIAPDGTVLPSVGPFTARGLRILVEPPTAPGTPTLGEATPAVAETPVASETQPAGTPGPEAPIAEAIATGLATALPEVGTPMPTG